MDNITKQRHIVEGARSTIRGLRTQARNLSAEMLGIAKSDIVNDEEALRYVTLAGQLAGLAHGAEEILASLDWINA